MKTASWILMSVLLLSNTSLATEPIDTPPDPLKELNDTVTSIEKEVSEDRATTQQQMKALEKKLAELSNKLGTGFGSNTIERRLTDLDRRLARIEKDIDQLKSRVSKAESKK